MDVNTLHRIENTVEFIAVSFTTTLGGTAARRNLAALGWGPPHILGEGR